MAAEVTEIFYKACIGRTGVYIQESQIDDYIAKGYTVYKTTREVVGLSTTANDESEA